MNRGIGGVLILGVGAAAVYMFIRGWGKQEPAPPPGEAFFVVSDFNVDPPTIGPGDSVTINGIVTNIGDTAGPYQFDVLVNDVVIGTWSGTLDPLSSTAESTILSPTVVGFYQVAVHDQSGSFEVLGAAVPTNLLINPDFLVDASSWWQYHNASTHTPIFDWESAGIISIESTLWDDISFIARWGQTVPVQGGLSYRATAQIMTQGVSGWGGAAMAVDWFDVAGGYLGWAMSVLQTGTLDWTPVTNDYIAPPGAVNASVAMALDSCVGKGLFTQPHFGEI